MAEYFDRTGKQITSEEWSKKINDRKYRFVRQTKLDNGILISTVWLGLEHGVSPEGHLIFETLLIYPGTPREEMYRYATEGRAVEHHECLVDAHTGEHELIDRWVMVADEIEEKEGD